MSAPPYQKFFWGSYHKHTSHLLHAREHGAYLLLIGALWNLGGKLPADDEILAAYAKLTPEEWAAIKPKLMPLFRIVRGKLTQPRVTEDLAKYRDTSCKRKEAGKAGGMASVGKRKEIRQAIASRLPTQPEPEPYIVEDKSSTPADPVGAKAWTDAVQLLTARGNMGERQARAFFGRLLSQHGLEARELVGPLAVCAANGTTDPAGYLTGAAKGVGKRQQPQKRVGFV